MTPSQRKDSTDKLWAECLAVMGTKEVDYASKADTMANFKRNAERSGLSKYLVWLVYFGKHCDSIFNAVKYHPDNPATETKSEPLRSRVVDAINYLTILVNLMDEDAGAFPPDAAIIFTCKDPCPTCGGPQIFTPLVGVRCPKCGQSERRTFQCTNCQGIFVRNEIDIPPRTRCMNCESK